MMFNIQISMWVSDAFSVPGDNLQFAFFLIENRFNVISEGAIHCQKNETHL